MAASTTATELLDTICPHSHDQIKDAIAQERGGYVIAILSLYEMNTAITSTKLKCKKLDEYGLEELLTQYVFSI
jgi:hypothetical protein